jgi:hypothetical protein
MRGDRLMKGVMEEKMEGKRGPGRKSIGNDLLEKERMWGFEEKGGGSARVDSWTARDLPYGRTLTKKKISRPETKGPAA